MSRRIHARSTSPHTFEIRCPGDVVRATADAVLAAASARIVGVIVTSGADRVLVAFDPNAALDTRASWRAIVRKGVDAAVAADGEVSL